MKRVLLSDEFTLGETNVVSIKSRYNIKYITPHQAISMENNGGKFTNIVFAAVLEDNTVIKLNTLFKLDDGEEQVNSVDMFGSNIFSLLATDVTNYITSNIYLTDFRCKREDHGFVILGQNQTDDTKIEFFIHESHYAFISLILSNINKHNTVTDGVLEYMFLFANNKSNSIVPVTYMDIIASMKRSKKVGLFKKETIVYGKVLKLNNLIVCYYFYNERKWDDEIDKIIDENNINDFLNSNMNILYAADIIYSDGQRNKLLYCGDDGEVCSIVMECTTEMINKIEDKILG